MKMLNLKLTLIEHSAASRIRLAVTALLLSMLLLIPVLGNPGSADAASTQVITLGQANLDALNPNCGTRRTRDCVAEGKVTGYQVKSKRNPGRNFAVPFKGKLISWSIELAKPTRKVIGEGDSALAAQLPLFNSVFGAPSQARISVLKHVEKKKKGPPRFKLLRQSPVQVLNPYFGTTVQFALSEPLNVNKGQIIGLTVPTWVPAIWRPAACNDSVFAEPDCVKAQQDYTWRASRMYRKGATDVNRCTIGQNAGVPNEMLEKTRPQQKIDSVKRYGCYYGANVLLYSATIVGKG